MFMLSISAKCWFSVICALHKIVNERFLPMSGLVWAFMAESMWGVGVGYVHVRGLTKIKNIKLISALDLCTCVCEAPLLNIDESSQSSSCAHKSLSVISLNMHRFTAIIQCLLSCGVNCLCLHVFLCSSPQSALLFASFSSCRGSWLCCWKWEISIEIKTRCKPACN